LPRSAASVRFLDEFLQPDRMRVLVPEHLLWQVLRLVAADLAEDRLAGVLAAALADDIRVVFATLIAQGSVVLADHMPLVRQAFIVATHYGLSLDDALVAALADRTGLPLLVADAQTEGAYRPLADDRATLRVVAVDELFRQP
jgi:hypothetical protein